MWSAATFDRSDMRQGLPQELYYTVHMRDKYLTHTEDFEASFALRLELELT
jgi:hypothetical protein